MSGKFVRVSKFRHVFGEAPKKEHQFTDVRPNPTTDGNCLGASKDFVAFPKSGGGGPVCVVDLAKPGRQGKNCNLVQHKARVTDLAFNPFNANMIATCSEDAYIKGTILSAEGVKEAKTYKDEDTCFSLKGHQKKVTQLAWHPTSSGVIASVSADNTVKVWDIEKQLNTNTIKAATDTVHQFQWNQNGSLGGCTSREKKIHIFDPRTNGEGMTMGNTCVGNKASRIIFCDNIDKIVVLGFTKQSTRQYMIYDTKSFAEPIAEDDIDQSAGLMMPHYDPDNNIIYIAGKGDSSIKYFEITNQKPYLYHLSEFSDSSSQKGIGWAPKYTLDTTKCEVAKCYRITRDAVQPVSFQVPRKSELFQDDIFPDTNSWDAAQTAECFFSGKNVEPKKVSMDPEQMGEMSAVEFVAKKSYEDLEKEVAELKAKLAKYE